MRYDGATDGNPENPYLPECVPIAQHIKPSASATISLLVEYMKREDCATAEIMEKCCQVAMQEPHAVADGDESPSV